jgi:carbamoyl-phosphate synthase small subunit
LHQAILALEDGTVFQGLSAGAKAESYGEVVFNTALTGYQEVFTDPSYSGQIVVLTNPQIGNYGTTPEDNESARPHIEGLVVREFSPIASNWRSRDHAADFLARARIPIISEIDTRLLVRRLRSRGVMRGVLSAIEPDPAKLVQKARQVPSMSGLDLATPVSTKQRYEWTKGVEGCSPSDLVGERREPRRHVVAYDFGIKHNILRRLVHAGCRVTVVPALRSRWRSRRRTCGA